MRKTIKNWIAPGALLAAMALAGCGGGGGGGGSSSGGGGTTTTGGGTTTTGGGTTTTGGVTYTSADGNAVVTYPVGTTPTTAPTITAATPSQIPANTPSGTAYTGVGYDVVEAAGFTTPVMLTITYPAGDVASGMVPAIYEDVNGTWTAVSGSAAGTAADTVTASISQPGIYGVLAPTNLTAPVLMATGGDPASSGNTLSWTSAGSGSITYNVYRAPANQALSVIPADQIATVSSGTTYNDASAQQTTTYNYAVSASAASTPTLSVVSNEASATPGIETNSQYTNASFVLNGSSSGSAISLSITLNPSLHPAPQAADLKSIQIQGTVLPVTSGVSVSGNTLTYSAVLPSQYTPLTVGQYYSITANVATTPGGSATAPLELTGPDTSATGSSDTTIGNFAFDINP